MDNATQEQKIFKTSFSELGGKVLYVEGNGLEAKMRFNKFRYLPFTKPHMRHIPLLILTNMFRSMIYGIYSHPEFIYQQIMVTNPGKYGLFLLSQNLMLENEVYDFVHDLEDMPLLNALKLKDDVLLTYNVCCIQKRSFSVLLTLVRDKGNKLLTRAILTYGVLDLKNRKLTELPSFIHNKRQFLKINIKPEYVDFTSIDIPASEQEIRKSNFIVKKDQIDLFNHLNANEYYCAALQLMLENSMHHKLDEVLILFRKECVLGDEVSLLSWKDETTGYHYCKFVKNDGTISAFLKAKFQQQKLESKL